jgi:hypothetical protein
VSSLAQRAHSTTALITQTQVIEEKKRLFIAALRANSGNVSKALDASGLARRTAYNHFQEDNDFATEWLDAQERAHEELLAIARKMATEGVLRTVTDRHGNVREEQAPDKTMLIFLMRQHQAREKWRSKVIQTGSLALKAIRDRGQLIGLEPEQIDELELAMREQFKEIKLV